MKTVTDEEKQPTPEATSPDDPVKALSPKRHSALVTYLLILFVVSFVFVTVIMLTETRRLKLMNQELQNSSREASASLTGMLAALQEENAALSATNKALTEQIEALETAAAANAEAAQAQNEALARAESEKQTLADEKAALEQRVRDLEQQVAEGLKVSELLHQAVAADEMGNYDRLEELLEQIEPMKALLSPTELDILESLTID